MNKIKIIYDVAKRMKDKEVIKGTFKAEALKDQTKVLDISNTFEKNNTTGQTKGKCKFEVDCEGRKMKMENSIDCQGGKCHGHHGLSRCLHAFHKHHHHSSGTCSFKDRMSRITSILGILSSIELEEKEGGSVLLSLKSENIPEDMKKEICQRMKACHENRGTEEENQHHHMIMKHFHNMEQVDFALNVFISKDKEIEKVTIVLNGVGKNEKNTTCEMKFNAELNFG